MNTLDRLPETASIAPATAWAALHPVPPCPTSLARIVEQAIASVAPAASGDPHRDGAALTTRGWALVFRVTYAYCLGVYGSSEVAELACAADPLGHASDPSPPDAAELRRLRRGCRSLLCQCLARALAQIGRLRLAFGAGEPWNTPARAAWLFALCFDCVPGQDEHQEAEARVRWAARLDSMELDE